MPDKKYKTPNGQIVEGTVLKEKYGEKFDALIQDSTFVAINENIYKAPNGKLATESELKNKYGERFNSLVEDNTFTLDTSVKKKDDSSPTSQNQELVSESEAVSSVTQESKPTTPIGPTTLEDLQKAELERLQNEPQQNIFPYIEEYNQATSITPEDEELAREKAENKLSGTFMESLESGYKKTSNFLKKAMTFGLAGNNTEVNTYADKQRGKAFDSLLQKGVPLNEIPGQLDNEIKEIAYKEELTKIKDEKAKDYLESLPEEQKQELEYEKINSYQGLVDEEKSLVLQYTIDGKKAQELNSQLQNTKNRIDLTAKAIEKLQEEGKDVPEDLMNHYNEAIELFNSRREELIGLGESYKNFGEKLQENFDKQIEEEEAIDLVKRNYGFIDNMKATFASAYSRTFVEGGMGFAGYIEYIKGNRTLSTMYALQAREQAKLTEDMMGDYRKPMEYDEVNSISDLGYFVAQSTTEQVPIMMLLAAPGGAGIGALGASSTGVKFAEMQEQNITGQQDYNPFQMISAPALEGSFEAGLGAAPTYGILKRTLGNTGRRTLFNQGVGGSIKQLGKDLGVEISTEMATEIGHNWIDMTILQDKSVNITDNIDHAGFKTLASMPVFLLGGKAFSSLTKQFSPKADIDQLTENLLKITELQQSLESATSEAAKSTIQKSILDLEQKSDAVFKKVRDDMSNMDKATYDRVNGITKQQAELRANADAIKKDGGIPAEQKQRMLNEMSKEFDALENTREKLVSGEAQLTDKLPPDQVIELKDQASRELVSEAGQENVTLNDQQITERAIEIYNRNEETAGQVQEQKTQPETEVQEEGAEVEQKKSEIEENRRRDLELISSDTENMTEAEIEETSADRIQKRVAINEKYDAELTALETTPESIEEVAPAQKTIQPIVETTTTDATTPTADTQTNEGVQPGTVQGEQQGQDTDIQPTVEPETSPTETKIKLGKTDKATEFTVKRNEVGVLEVLKPDGSLEQNQKNKVLAEYARQQDLTQGETSQESGAEIRNNQDLADNSNNPAEVAEAIVNSDVDAMMEEQVDYKTNIIAKFIGYIRRQSFIDNSDVNNINNSLAKSYLRKDGPPLDTVAKEMSEMAGIEITEQDIVDFILANPNGSQEVKTKLRLENIAPLEAKFTELTGLPANPNIIEEAVRQKRLQEEKNANITSLDIMTDEQLAQLYNESKESEVEQLSERTDETQDNPDSKQEPAVQEEGGETTKKVDLAKDLKLDDAVNLIDKYLNEVDKFGKGTLGMNLPVAVSKTVLGAMKVAAQTAKTTADVISAGVNALKKTDWYKNLTKGEQKDVTDNFETYINRPFKTNPEKTRFEISQEVDALVTKGLTEQEVLDNFNNRREKSIAKDHLERQKQYTQKEAYDKYKKADKAYQDRLKNQRAPRSVAQRIARMLATGIIDRQFLPKFLFKKAGLRRSRNLMINMAGAKGRSKTEFEKAYQQIYSDRVKLKNGKITYNPLNRKDRNSLDDIIHLRRIIEIEQNRKDKGLEPIQHYDNLNQEQAQQVLNEIKDQLGEKKFNDLNNRADVYFNTFKTLLEEKFKAGLISEASYNSIKDLDYQPRVLLSLLTDYNGDVSERGQITQKNDTGNLSAENIIQSIKEGSADAFVKNSEWLLSSALKNGYRNIAQNKINQMFMREFPKNKQRFQNLQEKVKNNEKLTKAEQEFFDAFSEINDKVRDNPIIEIKDGKPVFLIKKTPLNFEKAYYWNDGNRYEFFLEKGLHRQWFNNVNGIFDNAKNAQEVLSWISGSALVKFFATGNNPTFFLVNTPRDFFFTWNYSGKYSPILPVGFIQQAIEVAKAINEIRKAGRNTGNSLLEKGIEYGLSMEFLSTQGRLKKEGIIGNLGNLLENVSGPRTKNMLKDFYQNFTMQKLQTYSELMFRIALMQRSINDSLKDFGLKNINDINNTIAEQNGYENAQDMTNDIYESAVASGRSILDFSQGGVYAKDAETAIPYANVTIQSGRRMVEAFAERPVETTFRVLQSGIAMGAVTYGAGVFMMSMFRGIIDGWDEEEKYKDMSNIELLLHMYDGLSSYERTNYMHLPHPLPDENGNLQTIRIAKEHTLTQISVYTDWVFENTLRRIAGMDEIDSSIMQEDLIWAMNNNLSPIDFSKPQEAYMAAPAVRATATYGSGYDFFRDQPLVRQRFKPLPKRAEGMDDPNVEDFYKRIGEKHDLSPVRLKGAVESMITSPNTNPLVGFLYAGGDIIWSDDKNLSEIAENTKNTLLRSVDKRLRKSTSDFNRSIRSTRELEKVLDEVRFQEEKTRVKTNELIRKFDQKEITMEELSKEAIKLHPEDPGKVFNKYVDLKKRNMVDRNIIDIKYATGVRERAIIVMHRYGNIFEPTPENAKIIQEMNLVGGILTESFTSEFYKLMLEMNKD